MNRVYAFTDESGNHGFDFDKNDISKYFIVSAIIVDEEKLEQVEQEAERVRKAYFQTGEIKSSSIGKNHSRRTRILNQLLEIDFKVFTVVIDKEKIYKDSGLMYKQSFYKFVNNLVHKELRDAFKVLTICADALGGNDYMQSFAKYVMEREEMPNLLGNREFYFKDSKNSILVQVADFISGTLSFAYEPTKKVEGCPNYIKMLDKKIIRIEEWPKVVEEYIFTPNCINETYDEQIAELCYRQAQKFIWDNRDSMDDEVIDQLIVLKYLCFRFVNNDTRKYIPTKELINQLGYKTGHKVSTHYFRSKIIARLRDNGVIISSSSKGYKIPSIESELYDFIKHGVSVVIPMLDRMKKCRDIVQLATFGEVDLFEQTQYSSVRTYFEAKQTKK